MGPAIVCLSGGLDSTVALAMTLRERPVAAAVTFDYGQRAGAAELRASERIRAALGVAGRSVRLPFLDGVPGGALLDPAAPLPRPAEADLDDAFGAARRCADRVWVPNRNGVLIAVAAALAEALGADLVVMGFNREEAATFPDNSAEYLDAENRALAYSTAGRVRVGSPTAHLDKAAIVRAAVDLDAPLQHVWPCYEAGLRPCGTCESCLRFRRAVGRAGAETWLMNRMKEEGSP